MRIFITGGAGFIGSYLAALCLEKGHEVAIQDDLTTGSVDNIAHLRVNPRFSCFFEPVEDRHLTAELVDASDLIFHLAAAVGVRLIVESPVRTIETNVRATELILQLAAKKKKRVLVTSTSEVYGKREKIPFRETDDLLIGPTQKGRWSYACSKALDEFLALAYFKEKHVPTTVVRLFNTVGPRQTGRYGMVIPSFVRQALRDEDITVFGDGTQRRCFVHVEDTIQALLELGGNDTTAGEVYNIGSQEEISIGNLAERIRTQAGSRSAIRKVPYQLAYEEGFEDMQRRVPDLSKVKAAIGWAPRRDLQTILSDVIAFERERLSARGAAAAHA